MEEGTTKWESDIATPTYEGARVYSEKSSDRRPGLSDAFAEYSNDLDSLEKHVYELHRVLEGLLRPEEEMPNDLGDTMPPVSDYASRLYSLNFTLRALTRRIAIITSRVDN